VIGAGYYPHLPGGSAKKKIVNPGGMGQLQSPPQSARAVARWLIEEYESSARPLSSVALLTSEKKPKKFEYRRRESNVRISVDATLATMPLVRKAILDWRSVIKILIISCCSIFVDTV
jgi:hypothetical protein